ncbi:MAG: DUF262 domain-containing HNH endonuclease family protein [Gammaproteobacteria bacterium]
MQASMTTINGIFNGAKILEIPFFQRAYVWGNDQWERFLDDMKYIGQNQKPYFFGSVILKQQLTPATQNVGDVRLLIDGQQRLTTLIVFFKVLSLKDESYRYLYEKFLLQKPPRPLALCHNHTDLQSFEEICNLSELQKVSKEKAEKNNIWGVYKFFEENITVAELDVVAIDNNLMLVPIDLLADEDEQQIFDTINSLGVGLTTSELLKNHLFSRDEIDLYEKNWKTVFEKDDETKQYWDRKISVGRLWRTFGDLFFYAYLQIKAQEPALKAQEPALKVSDQGKVNFSRVENLFDSYKRLIDSYSLNKNEMISEIKDYALLFREHFDHDVINSELTPEPGIDRINAVIFGLENSTLIPYTLFILKNVGQEDQRNDLFGSIESYVMRRMVIRANTRNYNQLFSNRMIRNRILSKADFQRQIAKSDDQVNFLPGDEDLKKGFTESRLINKRAAGILYFIESKIRDPHKPATQLLGLVAYSLEHLMPKQWHSHWEKPAAQESIDERNRVLLTLGNLAIIRPRLNKSIKNASWEIKKEGKGRNLGLKHFAAGLETMRECLEVTDWNEREIEKRAVYLCEKAIEIWPAK